MYFGRKPGVPRATKPFKTSKPGSYLDHGPAKRKNRSRKKEKMRNAVVRGEAGNRGRIGPGAKKNWRGKKPVIWWHKETLQRHKNVEL